MSGKPPKSKLSPKSIKAVKEHLALAIVHASAVILLVADPETVDAFIGGYVSGFENKSRPPAGSPRASKKVRTAAREAFAKMADAVRASALASMTDEEIDDEIAAVRAKRRASATKPSRPAPRK